MLFFVERETFYMVGKKKWSSVPITLKQAKDILSEAGAAVIVAEREPAIMEHIQNPIVSDCIGFAFVAAQKVVF